MHRCAGVHARSGGWLTWIRAAVLGEQGRIRLNRLNWEAVVVVWEEEEEVVVKAVVVVSEAVVVVELMAVVELTVEVEGAVTAEVTADGSGGPAQASRETYTDVWIGLGCQPMSLKNAPTPSPALSSASCWQAGVRDSLLTPRLAAIIIVVICGLMSLPAG
jgi:hypothetical protein